MSFDFSISITALTEPQGSHGTTMYGKTEDGGHVYLREKNHWFKIRYMDANEVLPRDGERGLIYYAKHDEFSLFLADPDDIEATLPEFITVDVDDYTAFPHEEFDTMAYVWLGTRRRREPRPDPADELNTTRYFADDLDLSDEEWQEKLQTEALVEAAEDGYEDSATVQDIVGDEYYTAVVRDDRETQYELIKRRMA